MIGRGAYGRPWLLGQVMADLGGGRAQARPVARRAARHRCSSNMTTCCRSTARTPASTSPASIIGWYTKGLPGSAEFRNAVNQQDDPRGRRRHAARILFALAGARRRLSKAAQSHATVFFMQRVRARRPRDGRACRRIRSCIDDFASWLGWLARERASGALLSLGRSVGACSSSRRSVVQRLGAEPRAREPGSLAVAAADRAAAGRQPASRRSR